MTLHESIAYSLAAAFARGMHEESGPFPGREDRIKEYADTSWRDWLPAARSAASIGNPPETSDELITIPGWTKPDLIRDVLGKASMVSAADALRHHDEFITVQANGPDHRNAIRAYNAAARVVVTSKSESGEPK